MNFQKFSKKFLIRFINRNGKVYKYNMGRDQDPISSTVSSRQFSKMSIDRSVSNLLQRLLASTENISVKLYRGQLKLRL